jgi:hypothetical protein
MPSLSPLAVCRHDMARPPLDHPRVPSRELEGLNRAGVRELGEGGVAATASGMGKRHDGLAALTGPSPGWLSSPGGQVVDNPGQLGAVGG